MATRKDEISCVQLSKDTKAKLDKLGTNRKDTYESIILNLMDSPCAKKQGEIQEEDSDE
jgi:hypothetical protein